MRQTVVGVALILGVVIGTLIVIGVLGWLAARYYLRHLGNDNQ